jgi:hypothetical protein
MINGCAGRKDRADRKCQACVIVGHHDTTSRMPDSNNFRCATCGKERDSYRLRQVGNAIICDFCLLDRATRVQEQLVEPVKMTDFPFAQFESAIEPLKVRLVTPNRWDEIRRNRFVFGFVAAKAFEIYRPVRITDEGFVFETGDEKALELIGKILDATAETAIAARVEMARLNLLFNATDGLLTGMMT